MPPPALRISLRDLLVIVLAQTLALFAQAGLSRSLPAHGFGTLEARYLAYLVMPPILLVMLAPLILQHRDFFVQLFRRNALTIRLVVAAVALGVSMRIVWWSQLVARVSLGITVNHDPQTITGPLFSWGCPPLNSLTLGLFVMALLVPVMEETVHRGFLQSAFGHKGPVPAILFSSFVFTLFHPPSTYWFVFLMGTVLGMQFWVTGSLWATMISHATYNGLIQFDWRCLQGRWNPPPESLPLVLPGLMSLATLLAASLLIVVLLRCQRAGAAAAPAPSVSPARSRRAR